MCRRDLRVVLSAALAAALCGGPLARAGDSPTAPRPEPEAFRSLKKLAGTWQGSAKMGDRTVPVTIVYEATAAGSAVLERLFPGTPHEMISVYAMEGDSVTMTHYCSLRNHPKMTLKKADAGGLLFELIGAEGLRSAAEPHMHSMAVSFIDDNHVRETWTSFDGGRPKDQKLFDLARSPN